MASTNKTTHYNLSQYSANDKPTYLVDYNTDMSNIDTGIYNAQSKANSNESSIGTLSSLNTSIKTDLVSAINEVEGEASNIGNLSNLTTEAQSNLVSAINEVDAHADTNNQNIGTMVNLETTVKTSLVGAINEVNTIATANQTALAQKGKYTLATGDYVVNNTITLSDSYLNYDDIIVGGVINPEDPYIMGDIVIPTDKIVIGVSYNVVAFRDANTYLSMTFKFVDTTHIQITIDSTNWGGNIGHINYVEGQRI